LIWLVPGLIFSSSIGRAQVGVHGPGHWPCMVDRDHSHIWIPSSERMCLLIREHERMALHANGHGPQGDVYTQVAMVLT
jgi:hypothetical protein